MLDLVVGLNVYRNQRFSNRPFDRSFQPVAGFMCLAHRRTSFENKMKVAEDHAARAACSLLQRRVRK
jgi:hypothetical protein